MIFVMKCGEYDVTSAMIDRCPWSIKNKSTDEDDVTGKLFPLFCPIDNFKYIHKFFWGSDLEIADPGTNYQSLHDVRHMSNWNLEALLKMP